MIGAFGRRNLQLGRIDRIGQILEHARGVALSGGQNFEQAKRRVKTIIEPRPAFVVEEEMAGHFPRKRRARFAKLRLDETVSRRANRRASAATTNPVDELAGALHVVDDLRVWVRLQDGFRKKHHQAVRVNDRTRAGDDAKADELRSRVAKLKAEAADGVMDIPSPDYVNTAERARWFNLQAAVCATFLLRTAPADVERTNVCAFLWAWVAKSPDVNVTVGTVVAKAAQTPHGEMLMMAYAAAVIKDALSRKDPTMTDEDYAEAAVQMVDYYNRNKDYFGKNEVMEDYAKLVRKGDFKKMFIEQGREDDKKEHVQIK